MQALEKTQSGETIDTRRFSGWSPKVLLRDAGIGLALIRSHLEKLGGSIDFESEPGELTQFFVHLPYQAKSRAHD